MRAEASVSVKPVSSSSLASAPSMAAAALAGREAARPPIISVPVHIAEKSRREIFLMDLLLSGLLSLTVRGGRSKRKYAKRRSTTCLHKNRLCRIAVWTSDLHRRQLSARQSFARSKTTASED